MLSRMAEIKIRWLSYLLAFGWGCLIVGLLWSENIQTTHRIYDPSEFSLTLFWTILVPFIPVFLMVAGHEAWRRICPLSALMQLPRRLGIQWMKKSFNTKNGKIERRIRLIDKDSWLARNFWLVQFSLLFVGVCCRALWIGNEPFLLALFFLGLISLAIICGYLLGGKTWCHYFCPMAPVQKFYSEPGGLLESHFYDANTRTPKSMCRSAGGNEDVSTCVGCKAYCPDIDLEKQYWQELNVKGRKWATYGLIGLVIGFYENALIRQALEGVLPSSYQRSCDMVRRILVRKQLPQPP